MLKVEAINDEFCRAAGVSAVEMFEAMAQMTRVFTNLHGEKAVRIAPMIEGARQVVMIIIVNDDYMVNCSQDTQNPHLWDFKMRHTTYDLCYKDLS